jgi:hypothetical protein
VVAEDAADTAVVAVVVATADVPAAVVAAAGAGVNDRDNRS